MCLGAELLPPCDQRGQLPAVQRVGAPVGASSVRLACSCCMSRVRWARSCCRRLTAVLVVAMLRCRQITDIQWNFEKFLVLANGEVMRFRPTTKPDAAPIIEAIVGTMSTVHASSSHVVPAGIFEGHRMRVGTRMPPSQAVPFPSRCGPAEPA